MIIKTAPHNFGFKPFGAINRAVVLQNGAAGTLPTAGNALNLGTSWRVKLRLKHSNPPGSYVCGWMLGTSSDIWAIIFNFEAGIYELYCPANASGVTVRLALNTPVTSDAYHDIEFVYASNQLAGFLDGAPAGTLSGANYAPTVVNNAVFYLASRPGNASWVGSVASLLVEAGGTTLIDLSFDEESGPAENAGTLGGQMSFTDNGPREIV